MGDQENCNHSPNMLTWPVIQAKYSYRAVQEKAVNCLLNTPVAIIFISIDTLIQQSQKANLEQEFLFTLSFMCKYHTVQSSKSIDFFCWT